MFTLPFGGTVQRGISGRLQNGKPTTGETAGIRAIHKDFLKLVQAGREVWNDGGRKATNLKEGGVWDISVAGSSDAIKPGYFIPVPGHNLRPSDLSALIETRSCSFKFK